MDRTLTTIPNAALSKMPVVNFVKESGTGFAFPSQTLYFSRDAGLDRKGTEAAEARVRQWRDEGRLPFPDFSPEEKRKLRAALSAPEP
jgi:MscS family membrane protein